MRKINILLLSIFIASATIAQSVPKGMKYQAVARDLSGSMLSKQKVELKVTLFGSQNNHRVDYYSEIHEAVTTDLGLFNLTIGEGKNPTTNFVSIPWSSQDIWMEVAIKDKNRSDFAAISSSKLLAVPYAFHAATASQIAGTSNSATKLSAANPAVPAAVWSLKANSKSNPLTDKLGTSDNADLVIVTNNTDRLRVNADGNIDIKRNVSIGEDLNLDRNAYFNKKSGQTINYGPFTVERQSPTYLTGTLTTDQATTLKSTLDVTGATNLKNTLVVDGATNLNNTLSVNNGSASSLSGQLTVDGATNLNNTLTVNNNSASALSGTLTVGGATNLNNTLSVNNGSASSLSGSLAVSGTTSLQNTLSVSGSTTLNNTLNANGQVTINANLSGDEGDMSAYALRVQGSQQGVAIKVNGPSSNDKNFVTFWDESRVRGRIEGETFEEVYNTFDYIWANAVGALAIALPAAEAIACGLNFPTDVAEVVSNGIAAGLEGVQLLEWNATRLLNHGVVFESGSGDYAEWLEKGNLAEKFSYGDIVGVKGGKISKNTAGAEHLLVVSRAPIVLGNMPVKGRESNYEKVAFMGQVPVKVWGKVNIGDYIIPSGSNDGFGYAVSSDDMTFELFSKVVGRAWSSIEKTNSFSLVNVVVGLSTNELASKISGQQQQIDDLKKQLNTITAYLQSKDPSFAGAHLPTSTVNQPVALKMLQKPSQPSAVLDENSQYLDIVITKAREILEKNKIDINKYDQVRRLFTDKKYLVETMKKANY